MKKIWFIASREFIATVATRGFIVGILMVPLVMLFFATVGPRLMTLSGPQVHGEVALIDPTGLVGPELQRAITPDALVDRRLTAAQEMAGQAPAAVREIGSGAARGALVAKLLGQVPSLTLLEPAPADLHGSQDWLRQPATSSARRLAVIVIHADAVITSGNRYGTYELFEPTTLDEATEGVIKDSVRRAIVAARLRIDNLDPPHIDTLVNVDAPVTRVVTPQGKTEEKHPALNRLIPFVLLLYLMVGAFTGGTSLLSTTVEEKFNRVMEVLLSAVTPFQLMVGKILGQLAVSVVAMSVYVGMGVLILSSFALLGLIQPSLLLYLLIFFFTTYLIIGAFMGAVGAAVNDLRDAQTLLAPLNVIMVIPWLLAIPILRNPDSTLSVVLGFVPPVNSFAMLLRLASSSPPPSWQVGLSIAISLAAAWVALWFAAKIFRIALLIHGKPPNIATFIRWARTA